MRFACSVALAQTLKHKRLGLNAAKLPSLPSVMAVPQQRFDLVSGRLLPALSAAKQAHENRLNVLSSRLRPNILLQDIARRKDKIEGVMQSAIRAANTRLERAGARLERAGTLLDAYSYQGVLARGYVVIKDSSGHVVRTGKPLKVGEEVSLTFADGTREAVIDGADTSITKSKPRSKLKPKPGKKLDQKQPDLF